MKSIATNIFLKRANLLRLAIKNRILQDTTLGISQENEIARLFRNGIAVISYSILEDYIKERTGEVLTSISSSKINFNSLSMDLKEAATLEALKSVLYRATIMKKNKLTYFNFIQEETEKISSTSTSNFIISKYSLGYDKPNLSSVEIKDILKTLNVEGGWNAIQQITVTSNVTILSPETTFTNAMLRRHNSAHTVNSNPSIVDLESFSKEMKSLALAFDSLIVTGVKEITSGSSKKITDKNVNLRFLVKDGSKWKEYKKLSSKPILSNTNYNNVIVPARERAKMNKEILIIKKSTSEIDRWENHII